MSKGKKVVAKPLLTLKEVSKRTGISMPSLLRYKKNFQGTIPAVGKGRKQRYPEAALAAFGKIKQDNLKRRGRPKGSGKAAAVKTAGGLLSLNEIGRRTRISYPTLLRYVQNHLPELPHQGAGRSRRFLPSAVAVFERLRSESRRGRRKAEGASAAVVAKVKAAGDKMLLRRLDQIERLQRALASQLRELARAVEKPVRIEVKR